MTFQFDTGDWEHAVGIDGQHPTYVTAAEGHFIERGKTGPRQTLMNEFLVRRLSRRRTG
ncbi:hypothetical protein QP185_20660 [Sphingomonas aerolata]|uniref:hypothetical protein n=1 Tax=Sphingomonas aerolata TaxID=185951 RepID=UPI002FE3719E